ADPDVQRRNRLRAWEVRLHTVIERHHTDATGADRAARGTALHKNRDDILRGRRLSKSECTIALRSQIQRARVQLTDFASNRCTSVRAELQEDASNMSRRRLGQFEPYVRTRAGEVVDEVDEGITKHLGDVASELGLSAPAPPPPLPRPEVTQPPLKSRRLQTLLTMILGAVFGFGVVLAVTRLFAGLTPGLTVVGLAAGGLGGLLPAGVGARIRGVRRDRAVLDPWVTDVTATLRSAVEERVATRVLAAETAL